MTLYDVALFVHMLGLVVLAGAFAISLRAGARARSARDAEAVRTWLGLIGSTGGMFPTGLGLLLLSGAAMTLDRWTPVPPWIGIGLAGVLVVGAVGGAVVGRRLRALTAAANEPDVDASPERLLRLVHDGLPWTVMTALNGAVLGIVWVMSTKPGWLGGLAAVAAGSAFGVTLGRVVARRGRAEAAGR
jgi:hypothetical protein